MKLSGRIAFLALFSGLVPLPKLLIPTPLDKLIIFPPYNAFNTLTLMCRVSRQYSDRNNRWNYNYIM